MCALLKIILFLFVLQWKIPEYYLEITSPTESANLSDFKAKSAADETTEPPPTKASQLKKKIHLRETLSAAFPNIAQNYDSGSDNSSDVGETDLKSLFVKYDTDNGNTCLLDNMKQDILSWIYPNGTLKICTARLSVNKYLDLSYGNISDDLDLLYKTKFSRIYAIHNVQAFSAAYNRLNSAPYLTLCSMKGSLKYLSLQGNQFAALATDPEAIERFLQETLNNSTNETQNTKCDDLMQTDSPDQLYDRECLLHAQNIKQKQTPKTQDFIYEDYLQKLQIMHKLFGTSKESIAWARFPNMPYLLELDISNCSIEYINKDAFVNVTNLRKLFISNNKIMNIDADTFYHIQGLQYLDLSFTNVLNYNYQISMPTIEVILNLVYGLKIYQTAFRYLPELIYLDLSHSKITRNSAVAFAHLGNKLKYLSLCYTSFPMISNGLFRNTILEGLDLSGNTLVSSNMVDDAFDGIGDTLKCLYFEHSNLKDMSWSRPLKNLQILGLAGNNINALTVDTFQPLESLMVLDLSSNHIGNWYKSVFRNNSELLVLNLRSNNINMLTTEMLKDFETLEYLSLGDNNFLCNCMLREVVDVAANNNKQANCSFDIFQINAKDLLQSSVFIKYMEKNLWQRRYIPLLIESYKNIKDFKAIKKIRNLRFITKELRNKTCPPATLKTFNDTTLKFQLLDYDAKHYWCFNETEQLQVDQLNCQVRALADLESELHSVVVIMTAVIGSVLCASILGAIIYLKRWHIHYYYASLKSAALLSRASKESLNKFHHLNEHDPNMIYDIFISYCQNDRKWVLDELLPNVESTGDVSICLHERDFQIGVTILDNIISCMDRSRSLMLLISSKFLLSHWCQFEMYLAQHRIFEVSKEHLILVFLEDIPRRKRPKTLQYLMDIKTYIKWPCKGDKQPSLEERKLFWKRLRKSLEYIGIGTKDSKV